MNLRDNPFECDDVAASGFWTDQSEALSLLRRKLAGRRPLVIVSPRRCGMGGLVRQAVAQTGQRAIFVNVLMALSAAMLAELLLKAFLAVEPWERIRGALMKLRTKPVLTFNPENGGMEVSFGSAAKGSDALEDVLGLIAQASDEKNPLIVVLDQFQVAADLEPGTEKRLRAMMSREESISCVLLVGEESRVATLFENPQSPFFHFGTLLRFEPIADEGFSAFLTARLEVIRGKKAAEDARKILALTKCHPFCTQQLAALFWNLCLLRGADASVEAALEECLRSRSPGYAYLWTRLGRTARRILLALARGAKLQNLRDCPTSTVYSAAARLQKEGFIVRGESFEFEDPFFGLWLRRALQQAAVGRAGAKKAGVARPL